MPLCPFTSLSAVILCAIPATVAVTSTAGDSSPNSQDVYAVIGAMLAAVVVLVDYGGTPGGRRGTMQFMTVFISSAFIGSIGPGVTANTILPEAMGALTWHAWAMLGFVFGLAGWVATRSVLWVFNRRLPGAIDTYIGSKLPPRKDDES